MALLEEDQRRHTQFLQAKDPKNKLKVEMVKNFVKGFEAEICPTYPLEFMIPQFLTIEDNKLSEVIDFREKSRIPVLSYIHQNGEGNFSSIWRSGQIKAGFMNKTCQADSDVVEFVGRITFDKKNTLKKAYVFDCRPFVNAFGNKIKGKGYLDSKNYNIFDVEFGNIDNIHVMRKSFKSLLHAIETGEKSSVEDVIEWLKHIKSILAGASFVKKKILEGNSVFVNCSDGWDRTPQIVCLSKLMLEPYFRTVQGFRILLHNDWNGFGHKYHTRQLFQEGSESSPVFVQYLDCVHQLILQNPKKFEFSQKLLRILAHAFLNNLFIEFNFDNTLEYLKHFSKNEGNLGVGSPKELSIWELLEPYLDPFNEANYKESESPSEEFSAGISSRLNTGFLNPDYEFRQVGRKEEDSNDNKDSGATEKNSQESDKECPSKENQGKETPLEKLNKARKEHIASLELSSRILPFSSHEYTLDIWTDVYQTFLSPPSNNLYL